VLAIADRPTISGVIPTYDRKPFLRQAIESALAQTVPLDELIVVDDCSPDDPGELLATYGGRVCHLRQPRTAGASAARNAGVAAARGDIIAFLDDDDRWLPDKLARQVPDLVAGAEASLCGWQYLDDTADRVHAITKVTEADLRRGNPYCGTTGLVAWRSVLCEVPFDEVLPKGEDWDLFVRLAQRRPITYVPQSLYLYRRNTQNGLTQSSFGAEPHYLLRRALVIRKHRRWLGERRYRELIASNLLSNISKRGDWHRYIWFAFRNAGLCASISALLRKVSYRGKYGF